MSHISTRVLRFIITFFLNGRGHLSKRNIPDKQQRQQQQFYGFPYALFRFVRRSLFIYIIIVIFILCASASLFIYIYKKKTRRCAMITIAQSLWSVGATHNDYVQLVVWTNRLDQKWNAHKTSCSTTMTVCLLFIWPDFNRIKMWNTIMPTLVTFILTITTIAYPISAYNFSPFFYDRVHLCKRSRLVGSLE